LGSGVCLRVWVSGLGFEFRVSVSGFLISGPGFGTSGFGVTSCSLLLSSLELSDTKVYEPEIRALLGTGSHFWFWGLPHVHSAHGMEVETWSRGLGFRVWGLGFGVWGLGFEI